LPAPAQTAQAAPSTGRPTGLDFIVAGGAGGVEQVDRTFFTGPNRHLGGAPRANQLGEEGFELRPGLVEPSADDRTFLSWRQELSSPSAGVCGPSATNWASAPTWRRSSAT